MTRFILAVTLAVGLGFGVASRPAEAEGSAEAAYLAQPVQWYYSPQYRRSSGYGYGPRSYNSGSYVRGYRSRSLYDRGYTMRGSRSFDRPYRERRSRR